MPSAIASTATKQPVHGQQCQTLRKQNYHRRKVGAYTRRIDYTLPPKSLQFLTERFQFRQVKPLLDYLWLATGGQDIKAARILRMVPDLLEGGKTIGALCKDLEATTKWSALSGHNAIDALPYLWNESYGAGAINLYFRSIVERTSSDCIKEAFALLPSLLKAGFSSVLAFNFIQKIKEDFGTDAATAYNLIRQNPERFVK